MEKLKSWLKIGALLTVLTTLIAFKPAGELSTLGDREGTLPDLIVRAIKFPNGFKTGNCTDVTVYVANNSSTALAGKFKVQIYVSQSGHPSKTYTLVMDKIAGYATKRITFKDIALPGKGQAKLEARADVSDVIAEENEYNNKKLIYPKPTRFVL